MQISDYFPVEYVFNLASICRSGFGADAKALRIALQQRGLRSLASASAKESRRIPRISFWIGLCQSASLLDQSLSLYPTLLMEDWLEWPYLEQMKHLLNAWVRVSPNQKIYQTRQGLLRQLKNGAELNKSHARQLLGLQALGICDGENLTELGQALLCGRNLGNYLGLKVELWHIENEHIVAPFPPNWKLIWKLEKYLEPDLPGRYPVDIPALQQAVKRGAAEDKSLFVEVLADGLGADPPDYITKRVAERQRIRLVPGFILEFSDPEDLKALRQSLAFRKKLERILSPRHVALDPWKGGQVISTLYRKGLLSEEDFLSTQQRYSAAEQKGCPLSFSDRAYLLSLILLAQKLYGGLALPPGMCDRLSSGLDDKLLAAAANRADAYFQRIAPQTGSQFEEEPPPLPAKEMVAELEKAICEETPIDILYQASGRHHPERRHLTPLLIEQRGARFYLIAYCHTRRANRTFRLDRIKWVRG